MPKGKASAASLTEEIAELRLAIERLADEVRVLRDALDEARDEFTWAARNDKLGGALPPTVLTSMPLDPLSKDWQLNRMSAADLPSDSPAVRRTSLFD
jgi:hypothetical protein